MHPEDKGTNSILGGGKPMPPTSMKFCNANNEVIGVLDFSESPITFVGDVDASAKLFFDSVCKLWCGEQEKNNAVI